MIAPNGNHIWKNITKTSSKLLVASFIVVAIAFSTTYELFPARFLFSSSSTRINWCEIAQTHGGDCQVIGRRRPKWDCPARMRAAIPTFIKTFAKRPIATNSGGMRLEHSFGLWYTLRSIRPSPKAVIESGVHNGHTTWLIKQALPGVRVISLDPSHNIGKHDNVEYLSGPNFVDFNEVDWTKMDIDPKRTVVLFDDHQSGYRRVIKEGLVRGFQHFILDDNYDFLEGDNYSFKWACEVKRRSQWPGYIPDNFNHGKRNFTWQQHADCGVNMERQLKSYYEFPPLADSKVSGLSFIKDSLRATPLLSTKTQLDNVNAMSSTFDIYEELRWYYNMVYVELK